MDNIIYHIPDWATVATVSTPTASTYKLYPKSDGWYVMDDTGIEQKVVVGLTNGLLSATNGLTYSGDVVSLGGLLTVNTTIDANGLGFNVDNLDSSGYHIYQIDYNTGLNISQGYTSLFDWTTSGMVELGAGNSYFDLLTDQATLSVGSSGGRIYLRNTGYPGERISMAFGNAVDRFVMQRNASSDAYVGTNNGASKASIFLNTSGCTVSAGVTNSVIIAAQNIIANDPYTLYSNNIKVDNTIDTNKLIVTGYQINPNGANSGEALIYDGSSFIPQAIPAAIGKTYSTGVTFSGGITKTITHNLSTTGIVVQMWDVSTGEAIMGTLNNRTSTTVDVTLSATFSSPGVDIVIVG